MNSTEEPMRIETIGNATLYLGDCLEVMATLPDASVDMILCDPPYGTTACKWDTVIPFEPLWEQLKRVLKPNGAAVFTAAQPFTSALVMSNPDWFKYDWCWRKPKGTGHLNAKKQPMRDKEDVLVFYARQPTYNPQFGSGEPYTKLKGGKKTKVSEHGATTYGKFYTGAEFCNDNDGRRYPKQVLEFGVVERGTVHPTQKPVALMEYLIRTYTNEGETVLDNCMGSGTTGVACANSGRRFIGIERERKYFDIACERIENAQRQRRLSV
jgi:DNA modification methylase